MGREGAVAATKSPNRSWRRCAAARRRPRMPMTQTQGRTRSQPAAPAGVRQRAPGRRAPPEGRTPAVRPARPKQQAKSRRAHPSCTGPAVKHQPVSAAVRAVVARRQPHSAAVASALAPALACARQQEGRRDRRATIPARGATPPGPRGGAPRAEKGQGETHRTPARARLRRGRGPRKGRRTGPHGPTPGHPPRQGAPGCRPGPGRREECDLAAHP